MLDVVITETPKPTAARPTPGAPAPAPEGVVVPTPEEIADRARDTFSAMGWEVPDKLKPKVPEAPPAAPAAPAAPVTPPPAPMDTAELISRTAAEVATAVAKALPTPKAPEPQAPATPAVKPDEMSDEDRSDYDACVFLERSDRRHQGLAKSFMDYLHALYAYQEEWMTKNPDKEFNPDDEEHDAWFESHEAPVDRKTIDQAKIDKAVEERYERRVEPEMKALKADRAWTRARAQVFTVANEKIFEIVKHVCPEIAQVVVDEAGQPSFTEENIAKADKANSIANDILNELTSQAWPMIVELEKTVLPDVQISLTPDSNPVHAAIIQVQESEEARILADPNERTKGGKHFVPVREWNRLSASDRQNCRTLTVDDVEAAIVRKYSADGKKRLEYQETLAKRRFGITDTPAATPAADGRAGAPAARPPGPTPSGLRQPAPSISSASEVVTTPTTAPERQKSYGEQAAAVHFR